MIDMELLYLQNLFSEHVHIILGSGFSFAIHKKTNEYITMTLPEGITFADITPWICYYLPEKFRKIKSRFIDLTGYNPSRFVESYFKFVFGLQIDIPINKIITSISGYIEYRFKGRYDILQRKNNWYALGICLDIKYKL